jgi:PKD repeat protein
VWIGPGRQGRDQEERDASGNHGIYDVCVAKLESAGQAVGLIAFPGHTDPPADLDGDGLYEDVDGNGVIVHNKML